MTLRRILLGFMLVASPAVANAQSYCCTSNQFIATSCGGCNSPDLPWENVEPGRIRVTGTTLEIIADVTGANVEKRFVVRRNGVEIARDLSLAAAKSTVATWFRDLKDIGLKP